MSAELKALVSPLAERHRLSDAAAEQLAALLGGLEADPHAPTSVSEPASAVDVHLADSLVSLELEPVRHARTIADLGAGAGFPGIALAVALSAAHVHLIESAGRKCAFLERLIGEAQIANATVVHTRAEAWTEGREACDLVTARALAPLAVVVEYAAPLLGQDGVLVAWKGRRDGAEEAAGEAAATEVGLVLTEVRRVSPYPQATERHLHVFRKLGPTPARFPRRPGMARKRPLAAT